MKFPIRAELERQKIQGFIEPKHGVVGPNLHFRIMDTGNVAINASGLRYRTDNEACGQLIGDDGEGLLNLPTEHYMPFKSMIEKFIPLIGKDGFAKIGEFGIHEDLGRWKDSFPMILNEALDKYRWGQFYYVSPSSPMNGLLFEPDRNPNKPFGELIISYGCANNPYDLPALRIGSIESTLLDLDSSLFPNLLQ